jgi:hypothetical protein
LNNLGKYTGGAWSASANSGLNAAVSALAASGSDLYVGGQFTQSADGAVPNLTHIARYGSSGWAALPNDGLNAAVKALVVASGGDIYVGGDFDHTADEAVSMLSHVAGLGGGGWSALANNGLNDTARALAISGTGLYVGGDFIQSADGAVKNLNHIARFDAGSAPTATPTATATTPTPTATATVTPVRCTGDCNGSGAVTIDELIKGVNIALGQAPLTSCPSLDADGSGTVTIDELVRAVTNALNGCPAGR